MKILLVNKPEDYFHLLEKDISTQLCKQNETPDPIAIGLIHVFVRNKKEFEKEMTNIKAFIKKNTEIIVWVSWYKKSSKIATDISEDDIRNYALKNGLVDIKVCAVSDVWSGLKLVVPKALR